MKTATPETSNPQATITAGWLRPPLAPFSEDLRPEMNGWCEELTLNPREDRENDNIFPVRKKSTQALIRQKNFYPFPERETLATPINIPAVLLFTYPFSCNESLHFAALG